jgi:phosphate transport system substrate-binding protein
MPSSFDTGRIFGAVLCILAAGTIDARADEFDLSGIPHYVPQQQVSGVIRDFGFGFGGVYRTWEEGFRRFQPNVTFADSFPTSDAAIPALVTGATDLAPDGGEPAITEELSFFETYGYDPLDIVVASGTYDVNGRSPGIVVYVNAANPIRQLTLDQLDGIFGAARTGGLRGFKWTLTDGRDAAGDIRTWGQLGLTGDWADKPIQTYGHAPSGTTRFFQLRVLHNGDKWNPNYREYVETGSKMIGDDDRQAQLGGLQHMLRDELANDKYGIAWTVVPQAGKVAGLSPIALAVHAGDPYVVPSKATFQDHSYPLVRNLYIYLNRKPGTPIEPKMKEFLRYVLSREGQEAIMADGSYLPLPAAIARAQLARLE